MGMVYCLIHDHVFSEEKTDRKELGFYGTVADADAARQVALKLPGFEDQPDNFAILPFRIDDEDGEGAPPEFFFTLFYDQETVHRDAAGQVLYYTDIEKTVGVYSTAVKAAQALVARLGEPDYADHPSNFRIHRGELNHAGWETGFATA